MGKKSRHFSKEGIQTANRYMNRPGKCKSKKHNEILQPTLKDACVFIKTKQNKNKKCWLGRYWNSCAMFFGI